MSKLQELQNTVIVVKEVSYSPNRDIGLEYVSKRMNLFRPKNLLGFSQVHSRVHFLYLHYRDQASMLIERG